MRTFPLLLLFLPLAPLGAAEPKVIRDIAYAAPKHERQTLDLYAPPEGKDRPIVFWIHGGGWQAGDKKDVDLKPKWCLEQGYAFVSTNYRLLKDGVTIQQMAEDVATSLRWVYDHAKEHGGDPSRILVAGHSAGAQLAALVCTDDRYLKAQKLSLATIKGCVPVDGDTYDVPLQIATVEERRGALYRKKFGDVASQKELSPVTHVAKGKSLPPFLILHVAEHPEVKLQSERLARAIGEAGNRARTFPAVGKTHTTINAELGGPDDKPTQAFREFLATLMK